MYEIFSRSSFAFIRRGFWLYAPAATAGALFVAFGPAAYLNMALRPVNAALIAGLALGGGFHRPRALIKLATLLGKASYSMYILHIPLLWWYKRCWLHQSGYLTVTVSAFVYLVGLVIVSTAVLRLVEEPANRRIRQWAR